MRKAVRYIILSVVLITITVVCIMRWNAWFGNEPEPPYLPSPEPENIMLTYGDKAASSRIISWRADTIAHYSRLLLMNSTDTSIYAPTDTLIYSRSGKSVYYRVLLHNLKADDYRYSIRYELNHDTLQTPWYTFSVKPADTFDCIVFGDVQDRFNGHSAEMFQMVDSTFPDAHCWAFVGDIIERPTDAYWQYWFRTMGDIPTRRPIIAATGNHEYLKGVIKQLDSRWVHIFGTPHNGSHRSAYTSYYIDFDDLRFMVLDTDGFNSFSDYTIASAWVRRLTQKENGKKWNILMIHHPIYSAAAGRDNIMMNVIFSHAIGNVDIVLQGHDHVYARRITGPDSLPEIPVLVETTSAGKYYLPKVNPADERMLSAHPVYNHITTQGDTLEFCTYTVETNKLYDQLKIIKHDGDISIMDLEPQTPEIIDLPERYQGKNNRKIRRFYNRRSARQAKDSLNINITE